MATEKATGKAKRTSAPKEKQVVSEAIVITEPVEKKKFSVKDVDLNQRIPVYSGYQGRLVYKSSRTQEKFIWPEFGSEQFMELLEIRNAKNTKKDIFENNRFMFSEEYAWVIDYLGVSQYYKNALTIDNFDDLFTLPADEIEAAVAALSRGQKSSVAYRARQLIADGTIDSNKAIAALEKSLGTQLIER